MTLRLTIGSGKDLGKSVELGTGQLTIGRDDRCDMTLKDDKVSRKHALVEVDSEGRVVLRDLGSSNGTFVNGQRIRSARITGGEQLRFGDTVLVASDEVRREAAAVPPQAVPTQLGARRAPAPVSPAGGGALPGPPPAPPAPGAQLGQRPPSPSTIQRIRLERSLRRTTIVGVAVALALIVVAVLLATGALSGTQAPPPTAAQVIAEVSPSTVLVVSDHGNGTGERGSGWVWNASRGLIVTNAHVTAGGVLYTIGTGDVTLQTTAQGQIVAGAHARVAKLIGQALCEDIAVLRVSDTAGLKTLRRLPSQSQLKIGDGVVAVGYPATLSLLRNPQFGANLTGDTGVVSQPRTTFPAIPGTPGGPPTVGPYHDVVLTDTPINHGNSGGPLVDYQARLVGMNTAINASAQEQNYAIGVDRIDEVVPRLLAGQNVCQ